MARNGLTTLFLMVALLGAGAAWAQTVPGYVVEHYADVTDPVQIAFDEAGVIYVGRDPWFSGGSHGEWVKIHRVEVGGAPVTEYGLETLHDPDSVLVDVDGLFAPAGSVLVCGYVDPMGQPDPDIGYVSAILPDQTVVEVFAPQAPLDNPNGMAFDAQNRLLIGDDVDVGDNGVILVSTGPGVAPVPLINLPAPAAGFVIHPVTNDIYTRTADGIIRIYDENGVLLNNAFVTGLETVGPMAFGPGNAAWGDYLYTTNWMSGDLLRIDAFGNVEVIGTGFTGTTATIKFGPDGHMYMSRSEEQRIIRIVPAPMAMLDIKPGSCPNSFNRNGHGVLPVALVGTAAFDVTMVDLASITLSRADGIGGSVVPHEGPPGPHSVFEDVATPFYGDLCDCHELGCDGILDLVMKFKSDDVVDALELDYLDSGALVPLVLRGTLLDSTPFEAMDCIRLVPPGGGAGMLSVNSNMPGAWADVSPLDETLDGGGFASFDRTYPLTSIITLTAPESYNGTPFVAWKVNGVVQPGGRTIQLTLDTAADVRAIYRIGAAQQKQTTRFEGGSGITEAPHR